MTRQVEEHATQVLRRHEIAQKDFEMTGLKWTDLEATADDHKNQTATLLGVRQFVEPAGRGHEVSVGLYDRKIKDLRIRAETSEARVAAAQTASYVLGTSSTVSDMANPYLQIAPGEWQYRLIHLDAAQMLQRPFGTRRRGSGGPPYGRLTVSDNAEPG